MATVTLNITSAEFGVEIIDKIKALFNGKDLEITIRVKEKESAEMMRLRIEKAMNDVEHEENLISFTPLEYDQLVKSLSPQ